MTSIYPGALTSHWYQDDYPGNRMAPNTVVLHTTEGPTLDGYSGGSIAPNLTAVPHFADQKLVWYQHFDANVSSRALRNLAGGVETNTLNVIQVELVGTCDPTTHKKWGSTPHIYWPEAPDWALKELAKFLVWAHTTFGVPLSGPAEWPAYPSSYGATKARMSGSEWLAFKGICGHLHAPENDHGDPGALPFTKLLMFAAALSTKVEPGKPAEKPVVDLSRVVEAALKNPKQSGTPVTYAGVETVEDALVAEKLLLKKYADGHFGSYTVTAYAKWQKKCGYSGTDANGIPGLHSLTLLGDAHGFEVKP